MAFMTLSTLPVLIANEEASFDREDSAWRRAFTGEIRSTRQWLKRDGEFQTPPIRQDEAYSLEGWLLGIYSEHYAFSSDFYSEGGRAPFFLPASASIGTPVAPHFAGTPFLTIGSAGQTLDVSNEDGLINPTTDSGSLSFWMYIVDGTTFQAWHHFGWINGQHYLDGVAVGGQPAANYVPDAGILQISARDSTDTADATVYVSDVVVSGFRWTAAQMLATFQDPLPFRAPTLKLRGDVLDEAGPVIVRAKLPDGAYLQGRTAEATGFENNLRTVAFTLHEV